MPAFHITTFFLRGTLLRAASVLTLLGGLAACQSDRTSRVDTEKATAIPGNGVTVYAAGDIADCRKYAPEQSGAARTAELVASKLADDAQAAVLMLGDSTYPVGSPQEYNDCYQPTWGRFKARTYPTPGNHEYYSPQAFGYYGYFVEAAGPSRRGYYSFRLGKWHVISLNSNLNPNEHAAQLEWLKAELVQHKARCTLAFWHHPMVSSGGHGNNAKMEDAWKLLAAANAELVLASHDHHYERFARQDSNHQLDSTRGIRQFVVGTGGARLNRIRFLKHHSEVTDSSTHGVLKLVLKDTGYEWEYLPVRPGGFTDSGAALCH
jgi:hypothetical protein